MAESPDTVALLQARLAASRQRLTQDVGALADAVDVPSRVRREITSHPWKWALLAVAGGLVAARLAPLAIGLARSAASRKLLRSALAAAAPVAMRAGLNALAQRQVDFSPPPPGAVPPPSPHA